ncbi:hypothetical protein SH661x_001948 [Planctomicrobium sp. SH661]|uniref:hypothetical protein n=1 Tax=Planctomicrobium sp. SH661 TaxID=3448124 RepID=UPI003F5BCD47
MSLALGAGAPQLGKNCRAYYSLAPLAAPTWVHGGKIQGLSKTQGRDVAEVKERDLNETTVLRGHMTREVSMTLTRRPGDTFYDLILAAAEAEDGSGDEIVVLALMNGPITTAGVDGYMAEFVVTQLDDDQAHDSTSLSVTLRPSANYTTAPMAVVIEEGGS